eukprot:TRINITY_DN60579_c0_g1_i1.p1 TRINITY_DN60579_c0_g1~~TRINITY_DN60579_c0_g1_i1.p1  ORF type:complete len:709 (-),score=119.14 TRINITY_DN60579_c0_g1_i1:328-2454(-)
MEEDDLPTTPTEIPVDMWLYGAHQPLRIGSADASDSSSCSSFSSMSFLAKLEVTQERRQVRRSELANLLQQASSDSEALQKTGDYRATLEAARLRLERCQDTGNSTVLELSLTSSDLMWLPVASQGDEKGESRLPGWILAIAPKASLCNHVEHLGKAWVFCVGSCSPENFQQALFRFGSAGAIRWDFDETFDSEDVIELGFRAEPRTLCTGKMRMGGKFVGKPDVVSVELADGTSNLHRQLGMLAHLRTHPNVVKFHGAFYQPEGDKVMLTFQHAPRDLATRIQLVGALEQSRCVEVLFGVLRGVAYLHSCRIAHRDLHPRAVRIGRPHQVAIADFDAAVGIDDHDAMRTPAGTPGYVAPEAISRQPYGVKVDVFSAGAIYFTAATGEEPFRGAHDDDAQVLKRTLEGDVDFEKPRFKTIQYTLQFLVKAMLHHAPRARPSAADAAADCWQFLSSAHIDSLRPAIDVEEIQGQGQNVDVDDIASRSSSLTSVLSGALSPQSVLEQQARLPNLDVLEEATSSQERSSRSSPCALGLSASSSPNNTPQGTPAVYSEMGRAQEPLVGNSQMHQDQELADSRNVEQPARSTSLACDQALAAASDAPVSVSAMTPASAAAAQQPGLNRTGATGARPASSWQLSSWPLRALSGAAGRARQAGNSLRQSLSRRRALARVSNDELSPLVPQDGVAAPELRGRHTRQTVRQFCAQPQ